MATSPLFGWEEPDDTDLVKDGAAAIRTLGNAIDTSMGDLLGGTSGQVLSKASNTDMDFTWVTSDDANAIQNAIVDAKGDLITATAADTPARLAVGTNGQVLTADSTAATGLAWSTPSSGATFIGCRAYATTAQSLANGAGVAILFNQESYDTTAFHSTSSNTSRMTIPTGKTGYYFINCVLTYDGNSSGQRDVYVYKNGTSILVNTTFSGQGSTVWGITATTTAYLTAGDYLELYGYQDSGVSLNTYPSSNGQRVFFDLVYLGA